VDLKSHLGRDGKKKTNVQINMFHLVWPSKNHTPLKYWTEPECRMENEKEILEFQTVCSNAFPPVKLSVEISPTS
jgi:hypothetical protein